MNLLAAQRLLSASLLFALIGCGGDFILGQEDLDASGELEQEAVSALVVQGEAMSLKTGEGQVLRNSKANDGKELQILVERRRLRVRHHWEGLTRGRDCAR